VLRPVSGKIAFDFLSRSQRASAKQGYLFLCEAEPCCSHVSHPTNGLADDGFLSDFEEADRPDSPSKVLEK
jgi:hypothetical protein